MVPAVLTVLTCTLLGTVGWYFLGRCDRLQLRDVRDRLRHDGKAVAGG